MDLGKPFSTVTPTLDGDVLAALARQPILFTVTELNQIISGYSATGIRKVLRRLCGQGIVLEEQVGNLFAYKLNRDHIAASFIIGIAGIYRDFLERLESSIQGWRIAPVYVAVFGSAARGTMKIESDIDILFVKPNNVENEKWDSQIDELTTTASLWTGNDVRPIELGIDEIDRDNLRPLLKNVYEEGVTIIGSRVWLRKRIEK